MKKGKGRGFTTVELIIVIAVIGVLAAILIPVFANVIDKANARSALSDARNMIEQLIIDRRENKDIPSDIVVFVKKAGDYHLFGYSMDEGGKIKLSKGNPYKDYETVKALFDDYSLNAKPYFDENDSSSFDWEKEYSIEADKAAFFLVPKDQKDTFEVKGIHLSKDAELDLNYTNVKSMATKDMGEDTEVYHGILLPGTWITMDGDEYIPNPSISPEPGTSTDPEGTPVPTNEPDEEPDADPGIIPDDGKFQLTVSVYPADAGTITVNGEEGITDTRVEANSMVTLVFTPENSQQIFAGWTINGETKSTDAEYTFKMNSDKDIVAVCKVESWNGEDEEEPTIEDKENKIYVVYNAAQLAYVRTHVNAGDTDYDNAHIYLGADIYLNVNLPYKMENGIAPHEWTPIGTYTNTKPFTGYFNGEYEGEKHNIYGLYINNTKNYQGLFGYVVNATDTDEARFSNFGVIESYVKGATYTGGVIGWCKATGSIENVVYSGTVTSASATSVGGIVGYMNTSVCNIKSCKTFGSVENTSTSTSTTPYVGGIIGNCVVAIDIENCENNAEITTTKGYAAGICGYTSKIINFKCSHTDCDKVYCDKGCRNFGSVTVENGSYAAGICANSTVASTFSNCQNVANIKSNSSYAAGICANLGAASTFNNCISYKDITVTGKGYTAGICGNTSSGSTFEHCENYSEVSSTGAYTAGVAGYAFKATVKECANYAAIAGTQYVGGIVGYQGTSTTGNTFTDCANIGDITGTSSYIGGIVGKTYGTSTVKATFVNCYNSGDIKTTYTTAAQYIAGISPFASANQSFENCYNSGSIITSATSPTNFGAIYNTSSSPTLTNSYALEDCSTNMGSVTSLTETEFKADAAVTDLNNGGDSYKKDTPSINDGFPILKWQGGDSTAPGGSTTPPGGGGGTETPVVFIVKYMNEGNLYHMETRKAGEWVTVIADLADHDEFEFVCWRSGQEPLHGGDKFLMPESDVVIEAIWKDWGEGNRHFRVTYVNLSGVAIKIVDRQEPVGYEYVIPSSIMGNDEVEYVPIDPVAGEVFTVADVHYKPGNANDFQVFCDTESGWIIIRTADEFMNIPTTGMNKKYYLANDISLSNKYNYYGIGRNTSSTTASGGTDFTGIFNGGGHTISNINYYSSARYNGLFYSVGSSGVISDLVIKSKSFQTPGEFGMIAYINKGTITRCGTTGGEITLGGTSANDTNYIGGIVGRNQGGTVDQCWTNMSYHAYTGTNQYHGGIVAYLQSGTVSNCFVFGNMWMKYSGALIGQSGGGTVTNCYSMAKVKGYSTQSNHIVGYYVAGTYTGVYYQKGLKYAVTTSSSTNTITSDSGTDPNSQTGKGLSSSSWTAENLEGWSTDIWDFSGQYPTLKNIDPASYGVAVKPPVTPNSTYDK